MLRKLFIAIGGTILLSSAYAQTTLKGTLEEKIRKVNYTYMNIEVFILN